MAPVAALARRGAAELPLLVVCTLLLSTGADILPADSIVSIGVVQLNLARLLILAGLLAVVLAYGPRRELFRSGLAIPLALLLAGSLVATVKWGTDPRFRFLVESVALFYLAVAAIRARPEARIAIAMVSLVAVAISSLGGVAQVAQNVATGFYRSGCVPVTQSPPLIPHGVLTRAIGTFDNPNLLAAHVLLLAPLAAAAVALAVTSWQPRLALALAVALAYVGLVLTFSRTGVLFAILAAAAAVITSRVPQRRYLLGLAGALAIAAFLLFNSCGSEGAAGFGRTQEWKATMHVIRDHPLYGVGLGRLGDVLHARNPLSTSRHAHNLFLNWWAEAGPLALIAWVWLFAALLWRSARAALGGDAVARAALAALLGFVAYSMLDHPANVDRIATALWISLALAAALPRAPFPVRRLRRGGARA